MPELRYLAGNLRHFFCTVLDTIFFQNVSGKKIKIEVLKKTFFWATRNPLKIISVKGNCLGVPQPRNLAGNLRHFFWTRIFERDSTKSITIVSDLTARLSLHPGLKVPPHVEKYDNISDCFYDFKKYTEILI